MLYENLVSLLFQFHLVPRYLEAEALNLQRRLLEEEEEEERQEAERALEKAAARQRKKEQQKAAKLRQKEGALAGSARQQDGPTSPPPKLPEVREEDRQPAATVLPGTGGVERAEEAKMMVAKQEEETPQKAEKLAVAESNAEKDLSPSRPVLLPEEEEEEEVPPGLFPHLAPPEERLLQDHVPVPPSPLLTDPLPTNELTGEAPASVPATWFDKIILGKHTDPVLDSLWSPLAPSVINSRQGPAGGLIDSVLESPPGFPSPWSPFASY